jgi:GntR family transcriptional regulator
MNTFPTDGLGDDTKLPRYYQVYLTIRDWIYNGNYGRGSQLPTETELCETFGVSRITVRKAVDLLSEDKLVNREQGRGTFVTGSATATPPPLTGDMDQLLKRLDAMAKRSELKEVAINAVGADEETAKDLQLPPGTPVQRVTLVRILRGKRVAHSATYIPAHLNVSIAPEELSSMSVISILDKKGIDVMCADQLIGATLADFHDASVLGCAAGTPLIRMRLVVFDANYKPVERHVATYLADFYQHRIHLVRQPGEVGGFKWTQEEKPEKAED